MSYVGLKSVYVVMFKRVNHPRHATHNVSRRRFMHKFMIKRQHNAHKACLLFRGKKAASQKSIVVESWKADTLWCEVTYSIALDFSSSSSNTQWNYDFFFIKSNIAQNNDFLHCQCVGQNHLIRGMNQKGFVSIFCHKMKKLNELNFFLIILL